MGIDTPNPNAGQPPVFLNVPKFGSSLNTFDDPQQIADVEAADALNVVFDRGYASPRKGSLTYAAKPSGETNDATNLFHAVTSAGSEYVVGVYAPNFYVLDETNDWWVQINGSYTPPAANASLSYGYNVWNAGVGADVLYFGNGTDDTIKWQIALDHVAVSVLKTAGTLTLNSAAQFASSGTVSIKTAVSSFTVSYSSKSGNTLNLSSPLTADVPNGSSVAAVIQDMPSMPKGKIFTKFQGRQFIANALNTETTMYYSNVGLPEDFTVAGTPSGGGYYGFVQGVGGINGLFDFGLYLGVLKSDSIHRFEFVIDSTNTTKIDQVTPLVSDYVMGCPFPRQWVKKNISLYYPSKTAGIFEISPVVTGFQTTIQLNVLDAKIHNLYQGLDFTNGKAINFDTKLLWSCASGTSIDTILVYDTLRQYWTKFNNWAVQDWVVHKGNLYFLSYNTGALVKCFDSSYTDDNNPYTAKIVGKRYDFGHASMPKTMSRVYVQGYINTSTTLYCDVLFNEMGVQQKLTYKIIGLQPYAVQPINGALAQVMMGIPLMGANDVQGIDQSAVFKVYLGIPVRYGFTNLQLQFYSIDSAANWSVTVIGMNPRVEAKAPENLVINTDGIVPVPTPTVSAQS